VLWYKAWLETRHRLLISLGGMVLLSSYFVFRQDRLIPTAGAGWYYGTLHGGHTLVAVMWLLAVILLMMGGLLREKAIGTSSFTLALPVSRAQLMRVRILAGFLQAMALIIIPWGIMFFVAKATGLANSFTQAVFHMVLLASGGIVFFSVAVLISSLIEGEYTAPAVCFGVVFADIVAPGRDSPFLPYSPWAFISGTEYFNRATGLLTGPIPWTHAIGNLLLAAFFAAVAIKVIEKRDF
jgi:ABC-type transport system involved in multi-copper enzyme maturation permease subunit